MARRKKKHSSRTKKKALRTISTERISLKKKGLRKMYPIPEKKKVRVGWNCRMEGMWYKNLAQ